MSRLRVATWNIRSAIGPGPFPDRWWRYIDADRLRDIGAFLAALEADIFALQEVALVSRDGDLVDNAGDIARQLGMEVRYGAVRGVEVIEGGERIGVGSLGNVLLSRLPMTDARTVALPQAPAEALVEPLGSGLPFAGIPYGDAPDHIREPRCLLLARVGGLTVGTAHLSHIGSGERMLQASAVLAAFADVSPALLLGDLNAPIEAPELGPLATWTDGFPAPPGSRDRVTTDEGARIDHVLSRGAPVIGCRVLHDAGDLSDHYPIVAEVAVHDA